MKMAVIGCGNMGSAIVRGLLDAGWKHNQLIATHPRRDRAHRIKTELGIRALTSNVNAGREADIIFLGIKPQIALQAVPALREACQGKLVISIQAGVTTATIESMLGDVPVVRAMPNLAATVKMSATAICAGTFARKEHVSLATEIFESVGTVESVPERLMDAVTGLSGTGPMYAVHILEAMSDAGVKCGLPRNIATRLATQTLIGSSHLAQASHLHPAALKDQVSSPAGTSIAALHVLRQQAFQAILMDAIEAATDRSRELGE